MKLRNKKEVWRPIAGFEDKYEVSSFGRVKSLSRAKLTPLGVLCMSKEKILSPAKIGENGYRFVYLRKNGQSFRMYVHRLVAMAFLPRKDQTDVNHIDGDKTNNNLENLEWCNRSYNVRHATRQLGLGRTRKIRQLTKDGSYIREWTNSYEAAEKLGINRGNINSCINNHRKTAGGFRWEAVCA